MVSRLARRALRLGGGSIGSDRACVSRFRFAAPILGRIAVSRRTAFGAHEQPSPMAARQRPAAFDAPPALTIPSPGSRIQWRYSDAEVSMIPPGQMAAMIAAEYVRAAT